MGNGNDAVRRMEETLLIKVLLIQKKENTAGFWLRLIPEAEGLHFRSWLDGVSEPRQGLPVGFAFLAPKIRELLKTGKDNEQWAYPMTMSQQEKERVQQFIAVNML